MNLNNDLKWRIFMLNACDINKPKLERLASIRRCSQVCHEWREIILQSTLIWGRLAVIDKALNPLMVERVITRARESVLWLDVNLGGPDTYRNDHTAILKWVLEREIWERIEAIHVVLKIVDEKDLSIYHMIRESIQQAAPCLRSFSLDVVGRPMANDDASSDITLFNKRSPLLTSYDCKIFNIPAFAPFFLNLRSLTYKPASFQVLLKSLSYAPKAESLSIDRGNEGISLEAAKSMTIPQMNLQQLTNLEISMPMAEWISPWSRLRVCPAGFSTNQRVYVSSLDPPSDELSSMVKSTVSVIMRHYATVINDKTTFTELSLTMDITSLTLKSSNNFTLSFECGLRSDMVTVYPLWRMVLDAFVPHVANITHLQLFFQSFHATRDAGQTPMRSLLLAMDSVTHLTGGDTCFDVLQAIEDQQSDIPVNTFPSLNWIEFAPEKGKLPKGAVISYLFGRQPSTTCYTVEVPWGLEFVHFSRYLKKVQEDSTSGTQVKLVKKW